MNDINQAGWQSLSNKFLAISLREQLLILVTGLVAISLLTYTFLIEPNINQTKRLNSDILFAKSEQEKLQQQIAEVQNQFKNDPNATIRERIELLDKEIATWDLELQKQTNNLVPANQMASMLENVLSDNKGIKLIELASINPTPIYLSKPDKDGAERTADLYRHGVKIVLQGSYFDIQTYLQKLESLKWKFYWKKFDYQVDAYPQGLVNLEIYTLSTSQAFIGA
ncbi:type II secretion system protein GspM [Paraglaciecola sp.]|uniref:type II secretion system protein GspM n=1 Tax=Paraglaciecola sp. TaxID=1920173 RepID=UPI003EF20F25